MKPAQSRSSADRATEPEATSGFGRSEAVVREILREILVRPAVPVERFDANQPLGELGCDSIDLIQLAATLKERFGVELEGEQGTMPEWSIRDLADHIERGHSAPRSTTRSAR